MTHYSSTDLGDGRYRLSSTDAYRHQVLGEFDSLEYLYQTVESRIQKGDTFLEGETRFSSTQFLQHLKEWRDLYVPF